MDTKPAGRPRGGGTSGTPGGQDSLIAAVTRRSVRPAEAAELLGVCRDTVYVLMRTGRLRSVKVGRARLIPIAEIEALLRTAEEWAA